MLFLNSTTPTMYLVGVTGKVADHGRITTMDGVLGGVVQPLEELGPEGGLETAACKSGSDNVCLSIFDPLPWVTDSRS